MRRFSGLRLCAPKEGTERDLVSNLPGARGAAGGAGGGGRRGGSAAAREPQHPPPAPGQDTSCRHRHHYLAYTCDL